MNTHYLSGLAGLLISAATLGLRSSQAADSEPHPGLKLLAEGLTAPIALTSLGDGSGRLLVADQAGVIYVLGQDGAKSEKPFLDLKSKLVQFNPGMDERGLLGLALHPQFKSNRKFYVVYSAPLRSGGPGGFNSTLHLSEFKASDQDRAVALPDSERLLLQIDKPDWNHNSGRIAFGPDGFLYQSVGDGGVGNDAGLGHAPEGNGQSLQTFLGKVLRLDVDKGTPYGIPSDNPFADGKSGRPEIYAYGLRNPWGLSFDRGGSHDLILADVGQDKWEELNVIVKGGNYGWRVREGFEEFVAPRRDGSSNSVPATPPKVGPDGKPFIDPVLVYRTMRRNTSESNSFGVSICGGYVYRGKALPQLTGKYVFADWSKTMAVGDGIMLVATLPAPGVEGKWKVEPLPLKDYPNGRLKAFIWALAEDEGGELYVLTNGANLISGTRGKVFKLVAM